MTKLGKSVYLDHIRADSARFRELLGDCDPERPVPSCPEWTATDLLGHLGKVQHWWTAMLDNRPASPDEMDYQRPDLPAGRDELLAFVDAGAAGLIAALETADPADEVWTWSPTDHTVGFTLRRQAHEALIHRRDAELTVGAVTPLDPVLAADGVEEVLDVMFGGQPAWGTWTPLDHHVRVDCDDTDTSVWTRLGVFSGTAPDGTEHPGTEDIHVVPDPWDEPDAVVSGTAEDLDAWLWRRGDDAGIAVAGDRGVYDRFRLAVNHPIE